MANHLTAMRKVVLIAADKKSKNLQKKEEKKC